MSQKTNAIAALPLKNRRPVIVFTYKLLTNLAATLLFATQCSWLYIYQILPVLRRSDWIVADEIDNCDTSHYKDAKISLGDSLITFQGLHVVYKLSLSYSLLRDHLMIFKVYTFALCAYLSQGSLELANEIRLLRAEKCPKKPTPYRVVPCCML